MAAVTCQSCGQHLARNSSAHRASAGCREGAKRRELEEKKQGELPPVWRWILAPLGVPIEEVLVDRSGPGNRHRRRQAPIAELVAIRVPDWVADVVSALGGRDGPSRPLPSQFTVERLDEIAARAVPFVAICQKNPDLISAFRAVTKLGGGFTAASTFAADPEVYVRAFAGGAK